MKKTLFVKMTNTKKEELVSNAITLVKLVTEKDNSNAQIVMLL